MTIALLPEKHIRVGESLIGLGAVVLSSLARKPRKLDGLWYDIKTMDAMRSRIHGTVTLDRVILAVDFLFTIGAVTLNDEGFLRTCG